MRHFTKYSVEDFNDLLSEENHIIETDNFGDVGDKIEADGLSYFYISMCADDVEEALAGEPEIVSVIGKIHLIEVEGKALHFYIATY